jgi:autotransporter-associated beta strand protein
MMFVVGLHTAQAGSATWSPTAASADWHNAANWNPQTVPTSPADIASFGQSSRTEVLLAETPVQLSEVAFQFGASSYVINNTSPFMHLQGAGVRNDSGVEQRFLIGRDRFSNSSNMTFNNGATAGTGTRYDNDGMMLFNHASTAGAGTFFVFGSINAASPPSIRFYNSASAGHATFNIAGGREPSTAGGAVMFNDTTLATFAKFAVNGTDVAGAYGGRLEFWQNSAAAQATATANGSRVNNAGAAPVASGAIYFLNNARANNATLVANGSSVVNGSGGVIEFNSSSSADNASLTAGAGSVGGEGGLIAFRNDATGGSAVVSLLGNGRLDIGFRNAPGVTLGAVDGSGSVFLGNRTLTVGINDQNMTLSGVVQDRGLNNATGGALTKTGGGVLTLSGANTHSGGTNVAGGTLVVSNTTGSGTGTGTTRVESGAVLAGPGRIEGPVLIRSFGTLAPGDANTAAGALTIANDLSMITGAGLRFGIGANGQHSSLIRAGGTWTFAPNQPVRLLDIGAVPGFYDNVVSGLAADPGAASWTILTPGFGGTFSYDGAGGVDLNLTAVPGRFGNIATRMRIETGDNVLIGGFIITGTQPKRVILRGIGPSLTVPGRLENPTLHLFDASNNQLAFNDNWNDAPNRQEIVDSQVAPTHVAESAVLVTLMPGAYTAVVQGANDTSGIGLVELYDLGGTTDAQLGNISTRGFVRTGSNVMIGGLITTGSNAQKVIVRAIGPSLTIGGRLQDPQLELIDGNGNPLASNDNWKDSQRAEIQATGIPPAHDAESVIVSTLPPGACTAVVRGANGSTGIAVVEAYALD